MQETKPEPQVSEVPAPEPRRNLGYGIVQVVALVVTDGKEVWPLPPHQAAAVLHDKDPKQIVALCGPVTDLASVQDAVVLAQAYELRDALVELLGVFWDTEKDDQTINAVARARQVIDRASPVFASVSKQSAEQQLAEAMKGYDPALTPQGIGILTDDTAPSESQPA